MMGGISVIRISRFVFFFLLKNKTKQNRDQCNLQFLVYSVPFFISDSIY